MNAKESLEMLYKDNIISEDSDNRIKLAYLILLGAIAECEGPNKGKIIDWLNESNMFDELSMDDFEYLWDNFIDKRVFIDGKICVSKDWEEAPEVEFSLLAMIGLGYVERCQE